MKQWLPLSFLTLVFAVLSSCSKEQATTGTKATFEQQLYKTIDEKSAIFLVSAEELEMRDGQMGNLICKYTKNGNQLRVVANVFGTQQAFYLTTIPDGLLDEHKKLYFSPSAFQTRRKELAEKAKRAADEEQRRSLRLAESHKESRTALKISIDCGYYETFDHVEVSDVALKINKQNGSTKWNLDPIYFSHFRRILEISPSTSTTDTFSVLYTDKYGVGQLYQFTGKPRADLEKLRNAIVASLKEWKEKFPDVTVKAVN